MNLNKPIRDFEGNISEDEIFNTKNERHFISWGIEDKIYKATDYGFEIIKYNNYAKKENGDEQFSRLNSFKFHTWKGNIINGGSSYFGNIVECENALIVVQSDEKIFTINGPVTKWRVYPRSMNYENHLHVILDDRIEIYSFNQDYFVNQENKEIGIQFNNQKHLKRPSSYNKISKKIYNNVDLSGEITENLNSNHFDILESDDLPF